ncbi:hypothetical protein [Sagittula salina]|uniref:DnaA N-terminal domain-containing protein n=1 Tax=Sagittula salina TaxID=2820268 RepID=A0A940S529_9RHOB|nr:hypothetical protein [Sagittula salina]MBP0484535.1 hypothetical protein [Sagittula salina]
MRAVKAVGRNAAALKYDILSALGVHALAADKHRQRLALRMMVLITTRFNWQANELSIGRAEIARLWSVDERTVKRELAKLRDLQWLTVKRAGVKGRVTVYELDFAALLGETRDVWSAIGPDFVDRMGGTEPEAPATDAPNVVPFQRRPEATGQGGEPAGAWAQALAELGAREPAMARAWFAGLTDAGITDGVQNLIAPSRFVADYLTIHHAPRLLAALSGADGQVREVRITWT